MVSDASNFYAPAVFNFYLENLTLRIVSANVNIVQDENESIHRQKNSEHDNGSNQQTVIVAVKVLQFRRLCTHNDVQ